MSQLNELEQQLKKMQQKLDEMKQEQKEKETLQYNGPNIKIKLLIGNKHFMSNSRTLFNKQHGNTLFSQTYCESNQNIEGNIEKSKSEQAQPVTELYFPRNPQLFQYIIDYLSGYDLRNQLRELTVIELEKLLNDVQYYQVQSLYDMITSSLNLRYNPFMKSPILRLSDKQTCVTRGDQHSGLNQVVAVCGIMDGICKRYIEFTVISHGNLYVKLGVGQANPFRITRFPGRAGHPGCCFYGENGNLYRNGGTQPLGNGKWKYGDRIGIGVDLNKQNDTALIGFYVNGILMKNKLNLKDYMDVNKGVVFVVSLYTPNDCVCINQDSVMPQSL